MADTPDLLLQAWDLCYLDPDSAAAAGRALALLGGPDAAWGWWHEALAAARLGRPELSALALARARAAFSAGHKPTALALCDEVQALRLRTQGEAAASLQLQDEIDRRSDVAYTPLQRFIAHNSRAITCKMLGRVDDTLRHFLTALSAAETSGNRGAHITALGNLGGFQQDLYNLDDARTTSEQAFEMARRDGSPRNVAVVASNLVMVYHALGEPQRARDMAGFLVQHQDELPQGALAQFRTAIALGHLAVHEYEAAEALLQLGRSRNPGDNDGTMFWTWASMRCALARGDAARARTLAETTLAERAASGLADAPYDLMETHRALADACEQLGDASAALACMRRAHALYQDLVGRSARSRRVALEVGFDLARTQRERDVAVESRHRAEDDQRRLSELNAALQAQMAETERLHHRLRDQALHDPLTGLHNRRYLFETAPGLLELARRQGTQMCAVMIDLDHFKQLNDSYGHQAGDRVLQRFATLLRGTLRRSDLVCRYGGEEFVAVMPDIDAEGAYLVLGRLLESYLAERMEAGHRPLPPGTFSAGIALFPQHGDTLELLLQRADLALYAAKGLGRARIEVAAHSGHGALN